MRTYNVTGLYKDQRDHVRSGRSRSRSRRLPELKVESWYCDQCHVEVYQLRCPHCGKSAREKV